MNELLTNTETEIYAGAVLNVLPMSINDESVARNIARINEDNNNADPFFVMNLGTVIDRFELWRRTLPRVQPYYAVKCNNNRVLMRALADLGAGFDCASKGEIDQVLDSGLAPANKIIYANPCKTRSFIKHAYARGVDMMTFDNIEELVKVKESHPQARMIVRIAVSDPTATCPLNIKFGCEPVEKAVELLAKAAQLHVQVIGVSFHVGSGCNDPKAFHQAIAYSRRLFDIGSQLGHSMHFLDLGGGYPGVDTPKISFDKIANVINGAIDEYFPDQSSVQIVAEPGRFFASAPFSLSTNIIATTDVPASRITKNESDNAHGDGCMYYINDGVYGSFNGILYDHTHPVGRPLIWRPEDDDDRCKTHALIWGPTCDGLDLVVEHCRLRHLHEGEWLYWPNMGAYSCSAGSEFNGFVRPDIHYVIDHHHWTKLFGSNEINTDDDDKQSTATECSSNYNYMSSDSDTF